MNMIVFLLYSWLKELIKNSSGLKDVSFPEISMNHFVLDGLGSIYLKEDTSFSQNEKLSGRMLKLALIMSVE